MSGGQLGLMATVLRGTSPSDVLERAQSVSAVISSADVVAAVGPVQRLRVGRASPRPAPSAAQQVVVLKQQAAASLAQVQLLLGRQQTLIHQADKTVVRLAAEQAAGRRGGRPGRRGHDSASAAGIPVGDSGSLPATIIGPNAGGDRRHRRGPVPARPALPVGGDRPGPLRLLRA